MTLKIKIIQNLLLRLKNNQRKGINDDIIIDSDGGANKSSRYAKINGLWSDQGGWVSDAKTLNRKINSQIHQRVLWQGLLVFLFYY